MVRALLALAALLIAAAPAGADVTNVQSVKNGASGTPLVVGPINGGTTRRTSCSSPRWTMRP